MTFEVVEGAFKRGQQKLFDSRGYLYCVKRRRNAITYWHCSFRGKSNHCPASVIQHPEGFTVGVEHNHAGEVGLPETAKLTAAIKRKATWSRYRWLRERRTGSISKSFRKCSCWGGGAFHWNQALWRKVQEVGFQTAYMRNRTTNGSIRRLMALPFLPLEAIAATFDSLKPEAKTEPLRQFVSYIEENWIGSTLWLPDSAKLTAAWRRLPLTSREVTGAAAQRM